MAVWVRVLPEHLGSKTLSGGAGVIADRRGGISGVCLPVKEVKKNSGGKNIYFDYVSFFDPQ